MVASIGMVRLFQMMQFWLLTGLRSWLGLKFPMRRDIRARLVNLYYSLCVLPGMDVRLVEVCINITITLVSSKKRININDLVLPWKPLYDIIERELFPKQRKTGLTGILVSLLSLCEAVQRFFPPHEAPAMLATFLPRFNGTKLDSILACQSFMTHFLPLSHPQEWLPAVFTLWTSFNSTLYDDQWFAMMASLSELHLNPKISNPSNIARIKRLQEAWPSVPAADELADTESSDPNANDAEASLSTWSGLRKDVGLFRTEEWNMMMTKCLGAFALPVGSVGSKARCRS